MITLMSDLVTTKLSKDALRLLRLIAAMTGEKQSDVAVRLFRAEAARLGLPHS